MVCTFYDLYYNYNDYQYDNNYDYHYYNHNDCTL